MARFADDNFRVNNASNCRSSFSSSDDKYNLLQHKFSVVYFEEVPFLNQASF